MYNITDDEYESLSEIYRLFGNIARLKILCALAQREHNAGDLALVAGLSQSAASHQLKELKHCHIIRSRKEGLNIYYSLDDEHISGLLTVGIEHIKHITGEHNHA